MASEPSEYEKLRNPIADMIYELNVEPDDAVAMADRILALIAEQTKAATDEMGNAFLDLEDTIDGGEDIWSAMHAASALWPSHGTDGIEEKAK